MTENPRDDDTACAVCGQPIQPYGLGRHLFYSEDVGEICTACARTVAPDQFEFVEAFEREARARGWEP
jgi:hypothetical protein